MDNLESKSDLSCIFEEPLGPNAMVGRATSPDIDLGIHPDSSEADKAEVESASLETPLIQSDPPESKASPVTQDRPISQDPSIVQVTVLTSSEASPNDTDDTQLALAPAVPLRQLYYYQSDILSLLIEALNSPTMVKRLAVSSPAGSGKTNAFISLLPDIPNRGSGDKVFILVPTLEIMKQVRNCIRTLHRGKYEVEMEYGGNHPEDLDADIYIATTQSLRNEDQVKKYDPALFKCVVVDEGHHAAATSYLRQLHWFNDEVEMIEDLRPIGDRLDHGHHVPIIGFSATMARGDRRPLGWVFDSLVIHIPINDLLKEHFLSPVEITSMRLIVDPLLEETASILYAYEDSEKISWPTFRRRFTKGKFSRTAQFMDLVVSTYLRHAKTRRSTLVFCWAKETAADLTKLFVTAGRERTTTISDFKEGVFPVLVNCQVFTEGADMPAIDVVILAKPSKSENCITQMLGRGTRLSPNTGKDFCLVLDMFGILDSNHLGVEPCLWQYNAYDEPPIPKAWLESDN